MVAYFWNRVHVTLHAPGMSCRICHQVCCGKELCVNKCCNCTGSLEHVHLHCVQRWVKMSRCTHCRVCQVEYDSPLLRRQPVPPTQFALLMLFFMLLRAAYTRQEHAVNASSV